MVGTHVATVVVCAGGSSHSGSLTAAPGGADVKAHEIMTPNPDVVTPDEPLSRAAQIMRDRNIGIVPVVADRSSMTLQGVITDRDITIRHVADGHAEDCAVATHMTRDPIETVQENDDLATVFAAMKRRDVRRILVAGENGRLSGVIAQADIAVEKGVPDEQVRDVVEKISEPARPER